MNKLVLKFLNLCFAFFVFAGCESSYHYDSLTVTENSPNNYTYDIGKLRLEGPGIPAPFGDGQPIISKIGVCELLVSNDCRGLNSHYFPCGQWEGDESACTSRIPISEFTERSAVDISVNFQGQPREGLEVALYCPNNGTIKQEINLYGTQPPAPPEKVIVAWYKVVPFECYNRPSNLVPPTLGQTPTNPNNNTGGTTPSPQPQPVLPTAPSGLAITDGDSGLSLTWVDNSTNETSFVVMRSDFGLDTYADIATLPANTTTYTDPSNLVNVTYDYKIRVVSTAGSAMSTVETAMAIEPGDPRPVNLFDVGAQVNLTWSDSNMFPNETETVIERREPPGAWAEIAREAPDMTTYSDTSVVSGTTYEYRLKALRGRYESGYTPVATITKN